MGRTTDIFKTKPSAAPRLARALGRALLCERSSGRCRSRRLPTSPLQPELASTLPRTDFRRHPPPRSRRVTASLCRALHDLPTRRPDPRPRRTATATLEALSHGRCANPGRPPTAPAPWRHSSICHRARRRTDIPKLNRGTGRAMRASVLERSTNLEIETKFLA